MNNLEIPQAQLLLLIYKLWQNKEITEQERTCLKQMVIDSEEPILEALKVYQQTRDESVLNQSLTSMAKARSEIPSPTEVEAINNFEPPEQDDISSPLGNSLFERKKRHTRANELSGLAEALRPTQDLKSSSDDS